MRFDTSAVGLHQPLDDSQTEPQAAVRPRIGGIGLAECLEEPRLELRGNPLTGIRHDDADVTVSFGGA